MLMTLYDPFEYKCEAWKRKVSEMEHALRYAEFNDN